VRKLLVVLHSLVAQGNTVLVIEHNLDIIKNSDWVVDLGPEGGEAGGRIIAQGTVEQVAAASGSYTGEWLRKLAEIEKSLPHARQPRAKNAPASPTGGSGAGQANAGLANGKSGKPSASGEGPETPAEGARKIPEVFRGKPNQEGEQPKRRGRPPKTVRV